MNAWKLQVFFLVVLIGLIDVRSCAANSAQVVLAEPIIILEPGQGIRVEFPDIEGYSELNATQGIPEGTVIAPGNTTPFTVVCPDITFLNDTLACPEPPNSDVMLVVNNRRRRRLPIPILAPTKEPEPDVRYTTAIDAVNNALTQIDGDSEIHRLVCSLYFQAKRVDDALICCYEYLESPVSQADKEGQTLILYQIAMIFWMTEQNVESLQHAWKALKSYKENGDFQEGFLEAQSHFLNVTEDSHSAEKLRGMAAHHLALLAYYVFDNPEESLKYGNIALTYYKNLQLHLLSTMVQDFLKLLGP